MLCDAGETDCDNKGWIHHNCDEELSLKSQSELDKISSFFCRDCRLKRDDPEEYEKRKD